MKTLTIREFRKALAKLDEILAREGEIMITRRGKPVARLLPLRRLPRMPSHADLRASMPRQKIPSETLIRDDRDAR